MRTNFLLSVLIILTSCSGTKYLQQCQIDGVEMLSKGMTAVSDKLTASYSKVSDHKLENSKMIQIHSAFQSKDSLFQDQKKTIDQLSERFAKADSANEQYINNLKAGTALATKFCDLLKAISNADFYKVFSEKKDDLTAGIDSLANKYNSIAKGKVDLAYSGLFSSIALAIGKHKIKKFQKLYFKNGIDSGGYVITKVLEGIEDNIIVNYNFDIGILQKEYSTNYLNLQEKLLDATVKLEDSKKLIEELELVKKDLKNLSSLSQHIKNLSGTLKQLIQLLQQSFTKPTSCNQINTVLTKIHFYITMVENNSKFLK